MNHLFMAIFLLLALVSLTFAANTASDNEFEATFNKFMANFTAQVRQKASHFSYEHLEQLRTESYGQLPMSDSEVIQVSDLVLQETIDLFRVKAQQTFLDAINNKNKTYYIFDEDRSLWHKPDHGFEKVLFNGANRNAKILEDKLNKNLQETIQSDSSSSSLKKRRFTNSRLIASIMRKSRKAIAHNPPTKFISHLLSNVWQILPKILVASATVLVAYAFSIWTKNYFQTGNQPISPRYRMGNKVLTQDINIYLIWYGNWTAKESGMKTMEYFAEHISDSYWYRTMRNYYYQKNISRPKKYINGTAHFKKSYLDNYSVGSNLDNNAKIEQIIKNQLAGESPDPNGLYFIFGSPDIVEHFYTYGNSCGWHTYTKSLAEYPTYYSYIQNAEESNRCHSPLLTQSSSPNSDLAIDAMASIFAHEVVEIVTDPMPDNPSWINNKGLEIADICAWKFTNATETPEGKVFNSKVGDLNYLIQDNWDIQSDKCSNGKQL